MTTSQTNILPSIETLIDAAPSGFALAFHINFTTPRLLFQKYDPEWVKYYSENGLVMSDPTVLWGFENDGTKRWSDLSELDTAGVLVKAKDYGMEYGLTCALTLDGTRTIGSFARKDREFTDEEVADLTATMELLHKETSKSQTLATETRQSLEDLSVHVQSS